MLPGCSPKWMCWLGKVAARLNSTASGTATGTLSEFKNTFTVTHDNDGQPKEIVGSWADVSDRKRVEAELQRLAEQVELRNRFIRETSAAISPTKSSMPCLSLPPVCKWVGENASSP